MSEIRMTEAEFREHINTSFDNGSLAALDALQAVLSDLRARVIDADRKPGAREPEPANEENA